ncbi:transposase [Spirosoma aureum]|uniref:transposase n=1 Tax=Spirosoma aureum TaxID=2692134 RepID=UPI001E5668C9|nr:transposase [Spirosoma aureum]
MVDAILWLLRTGCQWRNLPPDWPHWQAVYYYFEQWKAKGTFVQMNAALNQLDRLNANREACPLALCIDSQSIKLGPRIDSYRGTDPHKRVNGCQQASTDLRR